MTPHRRRGECGFTLVEMMVVVLIVAILMGIAIPTYLGARNRAANRAAQASLVNALTTAQGRFANRQSYTGMGPSTMKALEPALTFTASSQGSTGPNTVSISAGPSTPPMSASMADRSTTGNCYYVVDVEAVSSAWVSQGTVPKPGTYYGAGPPSSPAVPCQPQIPGGAPSSGWQTAFSAVSVP